MHSFDRHLSWENCLNVRDLGGLPTQYGLLTKPGRLVRSDSLSRLTRSGQEQVLAYGIRTVIDLRRPEEAAAEPHAFMSSPAPIQYLNHPLEKFYPQVSEKIRQADSRGQVYCIIADHYPDLMAGVIRAIGSAGPGGVLIHCHSGKDRTGTVAALALRLAGVPVSTVIQDYALSQQRLISGDDSTPAGGKQEARGDFWSRPTATPRMMAMFLEHLDARYGGVESYLSAAGMSPGEMAAVRDRLLSATPLSAGNSQASGH